jgi:chromosome partitioning protein
MSAEAVGKTAHVIVLGNEKGGSGKSTTAMHIVTALLKQAIPVAVLDLDGRQRSLSRYLENRQAYCTKHGVRLAMPVIWKTLKDHPETPQTDVAQFAEAFAEASAAADVVVIDCPGRDSTLSREAHWVADTLITPMNDSFVDLDLLATVDPDTFRVVRPSFYSELIWECRKKRQLRGRPPTDWVVLRTRLSHLEARNMRRVGAALDELSKRIGFRVMPGLSERVIFRELFLKGLTLMDLREAPDMRDSLSMSQVAARQELRELVNALNLPMLAAEAA